MIKRIKMPSWCHPALYTAFANACLLFGQKTLAFLCFHYKNLITTYY